MQVFSGLEKTISKPAQKHRGQKYIKQIVEDRMAGFLLLLLGLLSELFLETSSFNFYLEKVQLLTCGTVTQTFKYLLVR